MNKLKRLLKRKKGIFLSVSIIALIVFSCVISVSAASNTVKISEVGIKYWHAYKKSNGDWGRWGQLGKFTTNTGKISYCIGPGEEFLSISYQTYPYDFKGLVDEINKTQQHNTNRVDHDKLQKIAMYAYYGYGYGNHNSESYIPATQMLIWRVLDSRNIFCNLLHSIINAIINKR